MEKIPAELIGRAVQDADFRRQLLENPEEALSGTGYELSDEQIQALKDLDPDAIDRAVEAMAGELDPRFG